MVSSERGLGHQGWKGHEVAASGETVLCESTDFVVSGMFEEVWLGRRGSPDVGVLIGDFYGDCEAAAVDSGQEWCLMVGEGLIAYSLSDPWAPFQRDTVECSQWWEFGRSSEKGSAEVPVWFRAPVAVGTGRFAVTSESGVVFVADAVARTLRPLWDSDEMASALTPAEGAELGRRFVRRMRTNDDEPILDFLRWNGERLDDETIWSAFLGALSELADDGERWMFGDGFIDEVLRSRPALVRRFESSVADLRVAEIVRVMHDPQWNWTDSECWWPSLRT